MYETTNSPKASKTTGDDDISMDSLKQIPELISEILTHLFNQMIATHCFPESLKLTIVLQLWKKKNIKLQLDS